MAKKIIVDPAALQSAATAIEGQVAQYKEVYTKLFSEVNGLSSVWTGADNTAFTDQIQGFLEDFQNMETLMTQYAEFLKKAAQTYTETQTDVINAAKQLSN